MGGGKSSGAEGPQSKPMSMGSRRARKGTSGWRLLWVPLFCDIGFPALLGPLFVTSTAVGDGLERLLFIATYCPYQALKDCQASKI